jgi:hypothetical protein
MHLLLTLGDFALQMRVGGGYRMACGPKRTERRMRTVLIVLFIDRICVFRLILFRMMNGRPASETSRRHEPMGRI